MADTSSPAYQAHVKALQTIFPRLAKYRDDKRVEGLLWLFSGMDDFGGPYQEAEFLLSKMDYSSLVGTSSVSSIDKITWINKTDVENTQDLTRSVEESTQTTFTLTEGLRIGSTLKVGTEAEVGVSIPVVKIVGGKVKVSTELSIMSEFSFQAQESFMKSTKRTVAIAEHIKVPPRSRVTADITLQKGQFHGTFTAMFTCRLTTYGLHNHGATLKEIAPKVDFTQQVTGTVAGHDNVDLNVVTEQSPL
jgi:hypothetical protein